jgi:hypothetical protein
MTSRSNPSHRLPPWCFSIAMKRELRLPLFDTYEPKFCHCGRCVDNFGNHIFQCTRVSKLCAHNVVRDGLAASLPSALASAGYILLSSTCATEPNLHLRLDTSARPFDLSFDPDTALPHNVNQGCPYTTVGAYDITITSQPSPSVQQMSFKNSRPTQIHIYNLQNNGNSDASQNATRRQAHRSPATT